MGRPKKNEEIQRLPGISIRFTPEERKPIDEAIKLSGLKKTEWARKALQYVVMNGICIT